MKSYLYDFLGGIQDPTSSILAIVENNYSNYNRPTGIRTNHSKFSIADERSEYLGKEEKK